MLFKLLLCGKRFFLSLVNRFRNFSFDDKYNSLVDPLDVTVTNVDNDEPAFSLIPNTNLVTTEGEDSEFVNIFLTTKPKHQVFFTFTSSDTSEGIVNPQSP